MGIKRSLVRPKKLLMHQHGITLGDVPPSGLPNVLLPYTWGGNHSFNTPKAMGSKRCYIGHIRALHKPYYIFAEGNHSPHVLKEVKPFRGTVGFAVWLCDTLCYPEVTDPGKYRWWGFDPKKKRNVCIATHENPGWNSISADLTWGGMTFTYLGLHTASKEREIEYWRDEAYRYWPDWLHHLETKAFHTLYKAAEEKHELRMPWGLFKSKFL